MRKTLGAAFAVLLSALPFLGAQQVERVLTLEESVTSGLNNNQDLLALREQTAIAQQRISEARSQIYPKIDLNVNASRFENQLPSVLPVSFNSILLPQDKQDLYYSTRFSLWQYLYAGGRYTTNLRLAEINLSQAQSQADAQKNEVIRDVTKSFFACIETKGKIHACQETLDTLRTRARGRGSDYESQLSAELIELRHEYEKRKLKHLDTIGLELTTVIGLSGELKVPTAEYDLNKCLAWAFQYRPELTQTQFQETIDSLRVNLSLTERYPTVTLGANYEWFGSRLPLDRSNWNATINVNVPVFDGWASWARIRQRRSQAREGKIRRARIEDRIRYEVREAYLDYTFWKGRAVESSAALASVPGADLDRMLEQRYEHLETLRRAQDAEADLEWAIGKAFFTQ